MKIQCQSCAAKYSIADHKIRGRAFKIRCKRCQTAIVVRGDALPAAAPAPAGEWHVVVDGDELGPLTLEALVASAATGDCHVWREGFDAWRLARDVPEVAAALGSEDDDVVVPPAATPAAAVDGLTGTRNESSVLFSIANLSALAAPEAARAPADRAAPGSEGSGLIDIRALAASLESPASVAAPERVDDLLAVGAPLGGGPLLAPVIAAPPAPRSRLGAILGASVGLFAVAAAALVGGVALTRGGEATVAHAEDIAPRGQVPTLATEQEPAPTPEVPLAVVEPPSTDAVAPDTPSAPTETSSRQVAARPRSDRARAPRAARQPAARVAPRPRPTETDGDRSIARLMADTFDRPAETAEPTRPSGPRAPTGSSTPTRAQVTRAMNGVASTVQACGQGQRGVVPVTLIFRGDSGRVASAQVDGGTLPPAVRSCVARAARGARVEPFTRDTFRVRYPFRL